MLGMEMPDMAGGEDEAPQEQQPKKKKKVRLPFPGLGGLIGN